WTQSALRGHAPGIPLTYTGRTLGPLPIYASVNFDGGNQLYIQKSATATLDQSLTKADLSPSLRAPLSTLPYLQVNASVAYRTTYFSESINANNVQVEEPVTRTYG